MKFAHVIELTRTLAMKTQRFMGSKFPIILVKELKKQTEAT